MSESGASKIGRIGWLDLTVDNADQLGDFYRDVIGWNAQALDMGGYSDYVMTEPAKNEPVAGVCHARGLNTGLPPVWLVYLTVANLDESIAKCIELGGEVIMPAREYGSQGRYSVIRDPAGAFAALYEEAQKSVSPSSDLEG